MADPQGHYLMFTKAWLPCGAPWIEKRQDTEGSTAVCHHSLLNPVGKLIIRTSCVLKQCQQCEKPDRVKCVTQMHYARQGIVTQKWNTLHLREKPKCMDAIRVKYCGKQHPGEKLLAAKLANTQYASLVRDEVRESSIIRIILITQNPSR